MKKAVITINKGRYKYPGFLFGKIRSEIRYINKTEVKVYSLLSLRPKVIKKLIKILKKDNIKKLAVDERIPNEVLKIPKEIEIVNFNIFLKKNIISVIRKIIRMNGIKNGCLRLGIIGDEIPLKELVTLSRELKVLYIYKESAEADLFYQKTGVPVITKLFDDNDEIDILITDGNGEITVPNTIKYIIETKKGCINDPRSISDVRLKNYETNIFEGIKNCVISDLIEDKCDIAGFVKKTLDFSR